MTDPRRPAYPAKDADEKDWPLGMGPDEELNITDPEAEDEADTEEE